MNDIESIRERFAGDIFATQTTGIVIEEVGHEYARCSLATRAEHMNAGGVVMGGAIFTLADFTFAVAANQEAMDTQSLTCSATFLSAARGGKLTAEARCVRSGRSTCHYIVSVTDESERPIASVAITGFRIAQRTE